MGFGDSGAVEAAGFQGGQVAEVVDIELAVDLRGVELRAALPEQRRLFAFAFGKYDEPVKSTPVDTTPAALPKGTDPSPFTLGHSK